MTVTAPIRPRSQQPRLQHPDCQQAAPRPPGPQQPSRPRDHRSVLPAIAPAVAEARQQVRAAVRYWHLPVDIDAAALLTSELVTNAVTHDGAAPAAPDAATATVVLRITAGDGRLRVDVFDSSPLPPVLHHHVSAFAESGRGLQLVDSLASGWGSYPAGSGKAVYFTLDFGGTGDSGEARDPER